jgi:effector-binding domain-containing protein
VRRPPRKAELGAWYHESLGELYATLAAQGANPTGSAGGVYADALFQDERGEAILYLRAPRSARAAGRIEVLDLPAIDLAVITHQGGEADIDRAYGALADYVARHALAVDGPLREFYPVNFRQTDDPSAWRTEVGWPIFAVGPAGPLSP